MRTQTASSAPLKAGASGYLVKSSAPEKLFEAIRDVHSGGAQFSAHIARRVVQYFRGPTKPAHRRRRSFRRVRAK